MEEPRHLANMTERTKFNSHFERLGHCDVPLMEKVLIVALVLLTAGCVHRTEPHFKERKCAKGTEMWDVPYRGQIVQVCVMVDPVTKRPNFTVPVVPPGIDPNDTDGDEGAGADKRHKHHFLAFWRHGDHDRD